jgi:pimeloyl-ACP methyl ester carboxylesterase
MSKPVILLIHGMGSFREADDTVTDQNATHVSITKEFTSGVNRAATCFGLTDYRIEDRVEIHEFNYSKYLDEIRIKLAQDSDVDQPGFDTLTSQGVEADVVNRLKRYETNLTKDEMLYTHWLDVPLYGLTHYGEPIRIDLADKINQLFHDNHGRDIHLISHSLGTAVAHDTLAKLYRQDADILDQVPDFKPGEFKFKTLWTFANVSRLVYLLNDIADPNHSSVTSGANGCTDRFYNIRHQFDPFTWFRAFKRSMSAAVHLENHVIHELNTHDFTRYLADPLVARYLLAELDDEFPVIAPDSDRYRSAEQCHREDALDIELDELKQAAEQIRQAHTDLDAMQQVLIAARAFKLKLKQLIAAGQGG